MASDPCVFCRSCEVSNIIVRVPSPRVVVGHRIHCCNHLFHALTTTCFLFSQISQTFLYHRALGELPHCLC
ncbi:unnamed protein product, partial [Heterobilharzia americana]